MPARIKLLEEGILKPDKDENESHWDIKEFKKNIQIILFRNEDNELEFDIINCDISLINAFRRILISEVHLYNNTSVIQDEVLCHRLGLLPLNIDPRKFQFKASEENMPYNSSNSLEFEIDIKCTYNNLAPAMSNNSDIIYINNKVYSKHLKWLPMPGQEELFNDDLNKPMCINPDILIAKLIPGQIIQLKAIVVKGSGKDHAKFSPVATASYRLMPEIILKEPILNNDALMFQQCFTKGVIDIVTDKQNNKVAQVTNARYDQCSRNVYRHPGFRNKVELNKIPNHVIFNIESVGALEPAILFTEAVNILKDKCQKWIKEIHESNNNLTTIT